MLHEQQHLAVELNACFVNACPCDNLVILCSGKERSRMLGEITMLRQLKHKNIMRLYDW